MSSLLGLRSMAVMPPCKQQQAALDAKALSSNTSCAGCLNHRQCCREWLHGCNNTSCLQGSAARSCDRPTICNVYTMDANAAAMYYAWYPNMLTAPEAGPLMLKKPSS